MSDVMKILLVEDESTLAQSIVSFLLKEGFTAEWVPGFNAAMEKIEEESYDCFLVDISLPDGNGLNIVRFLKKNRSDSGIIIITARNSLNDRVEGLDLGADDYLSKPFHLAELNSRIKAVLRRRKFAGLKTIEVDNLKIIPDNFEVTVNNVLIDFTRKEFDLLLFLASNKNRVLTKDSIAEHIWSNYNDISYSFDFLYSHVKNIRKKLMEKGCKDYIQSVYGIGYKFSVD
jgi:DNA-binding response OmpR family regulator